MTMMVEGAFSNAQDHLRQILKAVPVPHVVLAVGMATSNAALTGIADLEDGRRWIK